MAIDKNCAMDTPHHTSKGIAAAGDASKGRGASSMKDAARIMNTLTQMTPDEAEQFGISEAERKSLIRLDSGKVNIAPPSGQAKWFRLVGVPLGNPSDLYPCGDEVQTVECWTPPNTWSGTSHVVLNRVLDDIDKGLENGQRYSSANAAGERAAWKLVQQHLPDKSEKQCRAIVATWMRSETLFSEDHEDPVQRKKRPGLRVNPAKRPS
jgi:hypothetical protein